VLALEAPHHFVELFKGEIADADSATATTLKDHDRKPKRIAKALLQRERVGAGGAVPRRLGNMPA